MHFSCGAQKCSEFNRDHYGIKMESVRATLLSKVIFCPYKEMGVAGRDGKVQESEYFLTGPRKFCITIIYNISENEACRWICSPIKVRPLTIGK